MPGKSSRFVQGAMLFAAVVTFVSEHPLLNAAPDLSLSLLIDRHACCGKDPAVVTAASLRTMFIDRAFVVDQHRTMPSIVIAITTLPFGKPGAGNNSARESARWFQSLPA
ncbi:MAG TPA: hypothetical protein VHY84_28620 [Bryobacteraceae bacterium]|nr:hypothetical protein [Bryobacteraceae bacterium]